MYYSQATTPTGKGRTNTCQMANNPSRRKLTPFSVAFNITKMAESTSTEGADSAQYFKQAGFHKTFTLQATDDHGALDVSYSDLGRQPCTSGEGSESPPVVLFMPGMMASRFQGVCMGIVGEKLGVRILTVDR